jgi:hypothetical protein
VTFITDVISVTEVCAKTALRFVSWIVTQVRAALLCAGNPHWKATSGFARVAVPTILRQEAHRCAATRPLGGDSGCFRGN